MTNNNFNNNNNISTLYPPLLVADPARPSLADFPMEVILHILEELFAPAQIIAIEIFGPRNNNPKVVDMLGTISRQTKLVVRPPPLSLTAAAACRLFRHMYVRSRPARWGGHLHTGVAYHVDLGRDIFHVRVHRAVDYREFDRNGCPLDDPLAGALAGIRRMATSVNYISPMLNPWGGAFLRHLNPACAELLVLVPARGVERAAVPAGGLRLHPVLRPLAPHHRIRAPVVEQRFPWATYRDMMYTWMGLFRSIVPAHPAQRQMWERSWRLAPLPALRGYLVDERRLDDPNAFGLWIIGLDR